MYKVCELCLQAIVNDDFTSLDYHYSEQEAADKLDAILEGMHTLQGNGYLVAGEDLGFRTTPCDCCGDKLHGERYSVNVMENT